jgi:hypothetical protein
MFVIHDIRSEAGKDSKVYEEELMESSNRFVKLLENDAMGLKSSRILLNLWRLLGKEDNSQDLVLTFRICSILSELYDRLRRIQIKEVSVALDYVDKVANALLSCDKTWWSAHVILRVDVWENLCTTFEEDVDKGVKKLCSNFKDAKETLDKARKQKVSDIAAKALDDKKEMKEKQVSDPKAETKAETKKTKNTPLDDTKVAEELAEREAEIQSCMDAVAKSTAALELAHQKKKDAESQSVDGAHKHYSQYTHSHRSHSYSLTHYSLSHSLTRTKTLLTTHSLSHSHSYSALTLLRIPHSLDHLCHLAAWSVSSVSSAPVRTHTTHL